MRDLQRIHQKQRVVTWSMPCRTRKEKLATVISLTKRIERREVRGGRKSAERREKRPRKSGTPLRKKKWVPGGKAECGAATGGEKIRREYVKYYKSTFRGKLWKQMQKTDGDRTVIRQKGRNASIKENLAERVRKQEWSTLGAVHIWMSRFSVVARVLKSNGPLQREVRKSASRHRKRPGHPVCAADNKRENSGTGPVPPYVPKWVLVESLMKNNHQKSREPVHRFGIQG